VKKRSLLDSYAVLAYLKQEPNFEIVKDLLRNAGRGRESLLMNQINAGEVYYQVAKQNLLEDMDRFWNHFLQLPILFIANDFDLVIEAAKLKAQFPMAYADAFAVATALREGASIVTGDPDFKHVEALVKIDWL
jgi:predicted nucleic acid-binding protein